MQPGGDISQIQIQILYAQGLKVRSDGKLIVLTDTGPIIFSEPDAYQIKDGIKKTVPVTYNIDNLTYGFKVENYDPSLALVIDPLVMVGRETD